MRKWRISRTFIIYAPSKKRAYNMLEDVSLRGLENEYCIDDKIQEIKSSIRVQLYFSLKELWRKLKHR
jgi:hypothetical protein